MATLGLPTTKKKTAILEIPKKYKINLPSPQSKATFQHTLGRGVTSFAGGLLGWSEGIGDYLQYRTADLLGLLGAKKAKEVMIENAKYNTTQMLVEPAQKFYDPKTAKGFKTGEFGDKLLSGLGYMSGLAGSGNIASGVGVSNIVPTFTTFMGQATSEALEKGHDYETAKKYGAAQSTITTAIFMGLGGATAALGKSPLGDFSYNIGRKIIANPEARFYATQMTSGFLTGLALNYATPQVRNKLLGEDNKFKWSEAIQDGIVLGMINTLTSFASGSYNKYYAEQAGKQGPDDAIQAERYKSDGKIKYGAGRSISNLSERLSKDGGIVLTNPKGFKIYIAKSDFPDIPKGFEATTSGITNAQATAKQPLIPTQQSLVKAEQSKTTLPEPINPNLLKVNDISQIRKPATKTQLNLESLEKTLPSLKEKPIKLPKTDDIKTLNFYKNPQKVIEQAKIEGKFEPDLVKEIRKNPELAKDFIATRITGSGKESLAIRDSGIYAPKEFETFGFKDLKGLTGQSYNFLAAAGEYDNVSLEKAAKMGHWGPMKQFQHKHDQELAEKTMFALEKGSKIRELAKKHNVKINNTTGHSLFLALEEHPSASEMGNLAKEIRKELDALREEANKVRRYLGKKEIGYIKAYAPHMQKTSVWSILTKDNETRVSEQFDFIIPNEKKNPHAMKRINAEFEKETDAWKLLERYINAVANDIYISPLIEETKAINSVVMGRGHTKMSNFLNGYIKENLVGQSAVLDRFSGARAGTKFRLILSKVSMARTARALAGNFDWSFTTQPASIANTFARAGGITKGAQNTIKGLKDYATNKEIRKKVDKLPSMIIKSKGMTVGRTGGGDVDRLATRISESKLEKFNDFMAIIGDEMENYLTGASAAAAYIHGKQIGLTGKDLDMYADMVAQNTQSMYNKEGRPRLMNNQIFRTFVPFQTYVFEMYRYAKQLMGKGGGIPIEKSQRLSQALMLLISSSIYAFLLAKLTGKTLSIIGQYIPVIGDVAEEYIGKAGEAVGLKKKEFTPTRSPMAPFEDVKSIINTIDAAVHYGNFNPMRKELIGWGMGFSNISGAMTLNRFIDGFLASHKGYQTTKSGRVAFPVAGPVEKAKAMIRGPYRTKAGIKYIEGGFKPLGEKQSETFKALPTKEALKEFENIQRTRELNRLVKKYEELKAKGKDTSSVLKKIRKLGG